ASTLAMPVGFKNRTDGNIEIAIQAAEVSRAAHTYLGIDAKGQQAIQKSRGNHMPHLVLRGGDTKVNYDRASLLLAKTLLEKANLPSAIIVDCSHGNSQKEYKRQELAFQTVLN